jgi:hypothetical protein
LHGIFDCGFGVQPPSPAQPQAGKSHIYFDPSTNRWM